MSVITDFSELQRHLAYVRRLLLQISLEARDGLHSSDALISQIDWLKRDIERYAESQLSQHLYPEDHYPRRIAR